MSIPPSDIRKCLDSAREITEEYHRYTHGGKHAKKSIDNFRDVCRDYVEKAIHIYEVDIIPSGPTKAMYVAYSDHFEIYVRQGLSENWARYVRCKELFHIIIDVEVCRNLEIYTHLQTWLSPSTAATPSHGPVWEYLAEISALEFLFPYSDRADIIELNPDNNIDYEQLAGKYGVPPVHIEGYLSPTAMQFFGAFRSDGE